MLHNGHQLNGVVTGLLHMRKGVIGKLTVRTDLALFLCHTHMGLVDVHMLFALEAGIRPVEGLVVVYDLSAECGGLGVLHHTAGKQRNMFCAGVVSVHNGLDLAAFPQFIFTQIQFPVTVAKIGHRMAGLVPVIELAFQVQLVSAGCPLTVDPAIFQMVDTVVVMCIGKVIQSLTVTQDTGLGVAVKFHTVVDIPAEILQLGIEFQNSIHKHFLSFFKESVLRNENPLRTILFGLSGRKAI